MRLLLGGSAALLLLLGGCSGGGRLELSQGRPGLDVARAALRADTPAIALKISNETLARSPDDVKALLIRGDAETALGRSREAEASYRHALRLDPDSAGAKTGLGRLLLRRDPRRAEALFLEVLAGRPRDAVALNDLGIAEDLQGRQAAAQAAYRHALGVQPDMRAATVNLALSLALSGQAGAAVDMLRPIATAPDAPARLRDDLALAAELAGDRATAQAILSRDLPMDQVESALRGYDDLKAGLPPPENSRVTGGAEDSITPPSKPHG